MSNLVGFTPNSELYLFDARHPDPDHFPLFNDVYRFWHLVWDTTFRELEGRGLPRSDDFHRQDEICALVADGKIAGTFSFSWFDLNLESHRSHSYFDHYPKLVIERLLSQGVNRIMTMGQLAVDPEWRKTKVGPFVSEMLVGAACRRFVESDAQVLITYTRNNRRMNDLGYRHGAKCLLGRQVQHNVEVDYIAIMRQEVRDTSMPGIVPQLNRLWSKVVHSQSNPADKKSIRTKVA